MNISPVRGNNPWVTCDCPVIIERFGGDRGKYNEYARLANLSSIGLYMKAHRIIECGSILFFTLLLTSALVEHDTPKLATNEIVVRTNPQIEGSCGIAVKYISNRFL